MIDMRDQPWYVRHPNLGGWVFFIVVLLIWYALTSGSGGHHPRPLTRQAQDTFYDRPFPEPASGPHGSGTE